MDSLLRMSKLKLAGVATAAFLAIVLGGLAAYGITSPMRSASNSYQAQKDPAADFNISTNPDPGTIRDELMKSSYTDSYERQVSIENINWDNRVSGWRSEAPRRGMLFSGFVQNKIN